MHTIDLLRGQGIPARTTFGSVTIIIVTVAVPLLVAAGMLDRYLRNRTTISIHNQAIANEQETIDKFADAMKFKESKEKEQGVIYGKLSEVSSCVGDYIQWSPVLVTVVENMPREMFMSELSAQSKSIRERVVRNSGSKRPVNVTIAKRTLVLDINGGQPGNYDKIVRDYRDRLKSSELLGPKLEDIEVSQKPGGSGADMTPSYTMSLIFESES